MRTVIFFLIFSLYVLVQCSLADEEKTQTPKIVTTDASSVRSVIENSLPFIEREGVRWIEEKKCVTCHQVPFMVWALNAAADRGFAIEPEKINNWNAWARDWRSIHGLDNKEPSDETKTFRGSVDEVAQLLLGKRSQHSFETSSTAKEAWTSSYVAHLIDGQLDDGSWKPGGQLPMQKRSLRETQEVTTLWSMLAIKTYSNSESDYEEPIERGMRWLADSESGESTEWWAVQLLLQKALQGEEAARKKLIEYQNKDGGWGWLVTDSSDALGTGQALYALLRSGLTTQHPAVQRAVAFLCYTQKDNGAWTVRGTKKNKQKQIQPTATYWGTCWAVIALAESLPTKQ
jgi:hypothetical protein